MKPLPHHMSEGKPSAGFSCHLRGSVLTWLVQGCALRCVEQHFQSAVCAGAKKLLVGQGSASLAGLGAMAFGGMVPWGWWGTVPAPWGAIF